MPIVYFFFQIIFAHKLAGDRMFVEKTLAHTKSAHVLGLNDPILIIIFRKFSLIVLYGQSCVLLLVCTIFI